jgi:hypothetical protein
MTYIKDWSPNEHADFDWVAILFCDPVYFTHGFETVSNRSNPRYIYYFGWIWPLWIMFWWLRDSKCLLQCCKSLCQNATMKSWGVFLRIFCFRRLHAWATRKQNKVTTSLYFSHLWNPTVLKVKQKTGEPGPLRLHNRYMLLTSIMLSKWLGLMQQLFSKGLIKWIRPFLW